MVFIMRPNLTDLRLCNGVYYETNLTNLRLCNGVYYETKPH